MVIYASGANMLRHRLWTEIWTFTESGLSSEKCEDWFLAWLNLQRSVWNKLKSIIIPGDSSHCDEIEANKWFNKSFALIILPKDFMGIAWRIKILSWASRTWSQIVRGGLSPSDQPRQHLVGSLISLTHVLPWFLHLSYYLVSNIICLAETIGFYGTVPVCNIFQRDFMVGPLLTNLYFRLFARVLSPKSWTSFCQSP